MNKVYNILVINWQDICNPFGGGAEVHLHEIFKRLVQKGHTVTLLCCRYPSSRSDEVIDGIRIIRRGHRNIFNFIVKRAYKELLATEHFDIVIDDLNKIPFYTPLFVKKPIIVIFHHLFGQSIFLETSLPAASYVYLSEKLIPPVYRHVPFVCVSPSTQTELLQRGLCGKTTLVYNGVDLDQYGTYQYSKSKIPLIGYLGRIKKYKSVDHLLHALPVVHEQIPDARLVIVGDGNYRTKLEKLAGKLKISSLVDFTGAVSHQEKVKRLNEMWITVNPSPKEGWGLTVIEANACGTPVVAANSPGLRDAVVHEKTGLLYPYGDIKSLANSIVTLLTKQDLRNALATGALQRAKNFNWDKSAANMDDFMKGILNK